MVYASYLLFVLDSHLLFTLERVDPNFFCVEPMGDVREVERCEKEE